MRQKIFLLILFLAFEGRIGCFAQPDIQKGRDLYVSKSGKDTDSGGLNHPFLTINQAASEAQPSDKDIIHAGTYSEQINFFRGGTSEDTRIVFMAAPGEIVIVKGSEQIKAWKSLGGDVWQADIPDTQCGNFNPFMTEVHDLPGIHLGEVYVEGIPYTEQSTSEAVTESPCRWFAGR
jgi:alpha-N-arabinofuranosidase